MVQSPVVCSTWPGAEQTQACKTSSSQVLRWQWEPQAAVVLIGPVAGHLDPSTLQCSLNHRAHCWHVRVAPHSATFCKSIPDAGHRAMILGGTDLNWHLS